MKGNLKIHCGLVIVIFIMSLLPPGAVRAVSGPITADLPGSTLTTANYDAWGGISRQNYDIYFDFSASPTTITMYGMDLTDIWYEGKWPWPPLSESQGAQVRFGITANGFWSLHSIHSAIGNGGGSWDQQGAVWDHDDGFRKYLIQNQWSGTTPGVTVGNHQYNVEAFIPRTGTGPSVNVPAQVVDRAYNTFDMKITYTPTGVSGQYQVRGWVRLHKAASTTEMATRPGNPPWGSPYSWAWNKAINNQANPEDAWVPFYDGSWLITGDYTSARPYVEIMNWGVTQTRFHSFSWGHMVVQGIPAPAPVVWVDDDWAGLPLGSVVDGGKYLGYNAFATVQEGINAVKPGGQVQVHPGTYSENLVINKYIKLIGSGSGDNPAADTIITKNSGGRVIDLVASGLSDGEPILFKDVRVVPSNLNGFEVQPGKSVSYIKFDNVKVIGPLPRTIENENGFKVGTTGNLSHLEIINSAFEYLDYGWYFAKLYTAPDTSSVSYVIVTNTAFRNNDYKGIYVEKLSDATFMDVVVENNGSSTFWNDQWNAGFDINLKNGNYQNLLFNNLTVTGNGLGYRNGAGLMIKARGTGNDTSYSSYPATLVNVTIAGGEFSGNERGIRFGEPEKNNTGPTNVAIHQANILNNRQTYTGSDGSPYGGIVNLTAEQADATCNWWGDLKGPYHPTLNPSTTGDAVVGGVLFRPWLITSAPAACDSQGPLALNISAAPMPVGSAGDISAAIDDTTTGGSVIASAEYQLDANDWTPMAAQDGSFYDEVIEWVTANVPALATGVHNLCIRGTDAAGNIGMEECALLPVYDPAAGFVTGGGWIWSPVGAYADNPELVGKATFGFVSKYKKGATVPEGNTEFVFKAGNLNFHSTSYEWLVVAGPQAKFKGVGTINGAGEYGFMLTATDGNVNGGGGVDGFRIKIWDKLDGDKVVYDNKVGEGDDSSATTALGGGSIVIHK